MVDCALRRSVDILKLRQGNGPILFGVHGAGGLLSFGVLARYFDPGMSYFVVQATELKSVDTPYRGLRDLAGAYADELVKLQPKGPFHISGRWGAIVLETGQQLLARNRQVASTLIFDNVAPVLMPEPIWRRHAILRGIHQAYRLLGGQQLRAGIGNLLANVESRTGEAGKTGRRSAQSPPHRYAPRAVNNRLLDGYTPRKYLSRVVLIRSSEFTGRQSKRRHLATWGALTDDLEVRVIDTTHAKMWRPPDVQDLAKTVQNVVRSCGS